MIKNIFKNLYLSVILLFTYIPIVVMILLSFNSSKSRTHFASFTLDWYKTMFHDRNIVSALYNTLSIALISSVVAVIIGTIAAIAINNMGRKAKNFYMGVTNIPMLNADIVTGISLMLCFITFGISLSYNTILISHITFNIPYVILSVMPRLKGQSKYIYETAVDLGASDIQAFYKVVLPEIMPGVVSGFMLSFTMSLDDFIITHFTKGAGINTLSTLIYSQVRRGVPPTMYALSTVLFASVLVFLIISNLIQNRKEN